MSCDYGPLEYVCRVSVEATCDYGSTDGATFHIIGILTRIEMDTGMSLDPVVYFKLPSYSTQPSRHVTSIVRSGSGALVMSGIFNSAQNIDDTLQFFNSRYLKRIKLTISSVHYDDSETPLPSANPLYLNHAVCRHFALNKQTIGGKSVAFGTVAYAIGNVQNVNTPNFSSSSHSLILEQTI